MLSRPSAGGASSLLKPFVCTRCLRRAAAARNGASSATAAAAAPPPSTRNNRIRTFATATTAPNAAPAPPTTTANPTPAAAVAPLPTRRLIALAGPDAPKFLQGLTTNNVAPAQRAGWYTAFLNAQGRVLHDAFVYPSAAANAAAGGAGATTTDDDDWACFIEVDGGSVDALARVLRRHKLRSKVRMRVVDDGEWAVWSAWLPPPSACSADADAGLASALDGLRGEGSSGSGVVHLPDERAPGFGHRVLVPGGGGAQLPAPLEGLERVGVREYTVRRYLYGVPEGPREIRAEEALPLESNVDLMRGVDFRKGCYVGQELTIRTKHTGVVRKRILPVRLYDLDGPEPEGLEFVEDGLAEGLPAEAADIKKVAGGEGESGAEGGVSRRRNANRSAGKWLVGVGNIGLALCRLEMMTDVKVAAEGMGAGGGGYKPGMQFELKWTVDGEEQNERSVGIKAFVPEWHHLRAEEEARGRKKKTQQVVE